MFMYEYYCLLKEVILEMTNVASKKKKCYQLKNRKVWTVFLYRQLFLDNWRLKAINTINNKHWSASFQMAKNLLFLLVGSVYVYQTLAQSSIPVQSILNIYISWWLVVFSKSWKSVCQFVSTLQVFVRESEREITLHTRGDLRNLKS